MMCKSHENHTAAYIRLSREDGDKPESDSVMNQRALIREYVEKNPELLPMKEYVDDGYTGTNYDRPAFHGMMEEIRKGNVSCVIVKDLSRLGRNYIETGRYLEKIFPAYQVRFISILDHYDNRKEDGDAEQMIVPFKNLINDAYCRDISVKIRSHLDVKRKNGQFIGSFAGYGYKKEEENHNHLVIDEYAAEMVRLIFYMKLEGVSTGKIAEYLNRMGVLPPSEYKRFCGLKFDSGFRCGENPGWSVVSVNRILENEMYTGTMVQGKTRKVNYRIKEVRPVPSESWIRVKGTHEPIISPELFAQIQELRKRDRRTAPEKDRIYLMSGYVTCADCGQNLVRRSVKKSCRIYHYYFCSTYKNGGGCTAHNISEKRLLHSIETVIKRGMSVLDEKKMKWTGRKNDCRIAPLERALQLQKNMLIKELARYQKLKKSLCLDEIEGVVSPEESRELYGSFERKEQEIRKQYEWLGQEELAIEDAGEKDEKDAALPRELFVNLVENIIVYDKKTIEICFRCEDEIELHFEKEKEWEDEV